MFSKHSSGSPAGRQPPVEEPQGDGSSSGGECFVQHSIHADGAACAADGGAQSSQQAAAPAAAAAGPKRCDEGDMAGGTAVDMAAGAGSADANLAAADMQPQADGAAEAGTAARVGNSSSSSTAYRPSRLSTVSDSRALVLVGPVPAASHSSSSRHPGSYQQQAHPSSSSSRHRSATRGTHGGRYSNTADYGVESDGGHETEPPSDSHGSYSRRAAKAAVKAVAKRLRKLFIGAAANGSMGAGSTQGTAAAAGTTGGGAGDNSTRRTAAAAPPPPPPRDSDFRRSWQGPFSSSGGAAAAPRWAAGVDERPADQPSTHDDSATAQASSKSHSSSRNKSRRWKPPKWARKYAAQYGGYSSDGGSSSSSGVGEDDGIFDDDPFGPEFSPLRHNFRQRHPPQQGKAAAGAGDSPFSDPFGPAFSPLRQSMRFQPSGQQQGGGGGSSNGRASAQPPAGPGGDGCDGVDDDNDGFGPDWVGID